MQCLEREVVSIAQGVWSMILGLELRPGVAPPPPGTGDVVGSIGITGAWNGRVTLRCPGPLAARATSILFGVDPGAATPDQTHDVVGELTNVLGGNLKALLPEPCRLSLPCVGSNGGGAAPADAQVLVEVPLGCDGHAVLVTVVRHGPEAPGAP